MTVTHINLPAQTQTKHTPAQLPHSPILRCSADTQQRVIELVSEGKRQLLLTVVQYLTSAGFTKTHGHINTMLGPLQGPGRRGLSVGLKLQLHNKSALWEQRQENNPQTQAQLCISGIRLSSTDSTPAPQFPSL